MKREEVTEILEAYGLERILEDHHMDLPFVLDLLNELGYINLEQYIDEDT